MSDITLITPPDKIFNQSKSILLIYPSEESKQAIQSFLAESNEHFNVFLYTEESNIDWLLSVHKFCERTFLELDNLPPELAKLVSYFIRLYFKSLLNICLKSSPSKNIVLIYFFLSA